MTLYIRIHLVLLLSISLNALNASNLASFSELQAALKLKKEGPVLEYSSSTYEEVPNKFGTIVEPLLKLKPSKRQRSNAHIKLLNSILDGSWKKKEEKGHFKTLSQKETNTTTTRYKLTPLHAAAAMNDADAAKWLLKNGADINAQDHRGWTPRHFAALHETHDLLVDLEDYEPNKKLENKQGGTAYDNWYMTHPYDSKKFNVQVWSHKEKRVATRPATHIEKKTRKKFTPNIIISPVALLSLWSSSLDADNSSSKLKESLQTLRVKTPPEGYFPRGDL